jgi:hypothetical protein
LPVEKEINMEQQHVRTEVGPKFLLDIEGTKYPWVEDVITVPQLRKLGSLPENLPVLEVDLHAGTDRELREDENVQLKPGQGFSKKVSFKRG